MKRIFISPGFLQSTPGGRKRLLIVSVAPKLIGLAIRRYLFRDREKKMMRDF